MLLPLPAVRAALRLDTPEKRFAWAAEQLYGALVASPAVAADIPLGVPAKATTRGIADVKGGFAYYADAFKADGRGNYFDAYFRLPFDMAQYHRGVPLLRCIGQLSLDACLPYVGTIPAGEPIFDNANSKTVEQYLVEQASNIIVAAGATFDFSNATFEIDKVGFQPSEFQRQLVHFFGIGLVFNRTGIVGNDRYSDIGTCDPV